MDSPASIFGLAAAPFALLAAWAFERARTADSLKALRRVEQGDATLMPPWFWATPVIATASVAGAASELGIAGALALSAVAFLLALGVWRSVRSGLLQVAAGGVVLQQYVPRAMRPLSVVRMPQAPPLAAPGRARLVVGVVVLVALAATVAGNVIWAVRTGANLALAAIGGVAMIALGLSVASQWRAWKRWQQFPPPVDALSSDSLLGAVRESPLSAPLLVEHAKSLVKQSQASQALFELRLAAVLRPWDRAPKEMIAGLRAEHVHVAPPDEPAVAPHRPDIAGLPLSADAPPLLPPEHRVTILDASAFVDVLIHAQGGRNMFFAWVAPEDQELPESLLPWTAQFAPVGLSAGHGSIVWTILLDEESVPMLAQHAREHSESWRSAALVTAEETLALADLQWMKGILSCPAFCREYGELRRSAAVKADPELVGLESMANA